MILVIPFSVDPYCSCKLHEDLFPSYSSQDSNITKRMCEFEQLWIFANVLFSPLFYRWRDVDFFHSYPSCTPPLCFFSAAADSS